MRSRRLVPLAMMVAAMAAVAAGCAPKEQRDEVPPRADDVRPAPRAQESPPASGSREVLVYFARSDSCEVLPVRRVVAGGTPYAMLRATLDSLLAGPTPQEAAAGYRSAIPDSLEVLRHRMRHVTENRDSPHEGRRVEVQFVEPLPDGLVRVSFSKEINAYGGGAARVCTIVRQVQETVMQFGEWRGVSIAVDGETRGVLQP
jgi:spore germination protein GerM